MKVWLMFISVLIFCDGTTVCFSQELPIKPSRTISFTTDEGTGMNVDVSPDGKTLVFDLLGDLYTLPVTGGKATQLTKGVALNVGPVWSPDGKQIAFIGDFSGSAHLNVMNISGTSHKALGSSDKLWGIGTYPLIWMLDNKRIEMDNALYNVSDGGKLPLPDSIGRVRGFSTGGKFWYHSRGSKLYQYNVENGTNTLMPDLKGFILSSPDGKWLVYDNGVHCLMVKNLITGKDRVLVSLLMHRSHLSFSPDSKNIYTSYGGKIHRIDVEDGIDDIIPFSCDVKVALGPLDYNTSRVKNDSIKVKYTRSASESPDGKHLIFSALNRIYIMDLPNGKPRILFPQSFNQYQPCWSPDSKWIAYVSWCDTLGGELWKVPVLGGMPMQVTKIPGEYQRPVWSPDGETIAVLKGGFSYGDALQTKLHAMGKGDPALGDRDDPGIGQLQLIAVGSGQMQAVTDSIPLWNQLAFSSNGSRIIYEPKADDNKKEISQLASKDVDGNGIQVLAIRSITRDPFISEPDPEWLLQRSISPDGRYIVYSRGEDLYLVLVDKTAAPTLIYDYYKQLPIFRFAKGIDPNWERGGKLLCWTYANKFYEINPDKIVRETRKTQQPKNEFGFTGDSCIMANVNPDKIIPLNITVPAYYAHGIVALKNARIVTMRGNQVIENGTILIKDGRFAAVGPVNEVRIPKGVKIVDLTGKTIIPGFVDLHLHMRVPPDIFPQQSWMYLVNLAYGVTTARDPSSSYDSFGYTELLQSGQMIGPRLFSSGRAVKTDEGICSDNLADALGTVQKRKLLGGTFIKQYVLTTRVEKEWLLLASSAEGLNMTNEGGTTGWLQVLGMFKDGSSGVEHNFDGDAYKDVITFIAQTGTYFTPTLQVTPEPGAKQYFNYKYWHGDQPKLARFDQVHSDETANGAEGYDWITREIPKDTTDASFIHADSIDAAIRKAGGLVTMGSHGNDEGIGVHNEIWALKMGGISNLEALQAATIMAAGALGVQKDIGSIEIGKIADLIILNSDPLQDIHHTRDIKYVMKDGILYDGDTLDELWPVKKKCPEWQLKSHSTIMK